MTGDPRYGDHHPDTVRVVSYNVLNKGHFPEKRQALLTKVLAKYDPDLIGFQEIIPSWTQHFENTLLQEYGFVLKYRSEESPEATPIFWKKSKFRLTDSGHFWLSETPDRESVGRGASYPRILSWVRLETIKTGETVFFLNTHFDFAPQVQIESAKLIVSRVKKLCGDKAVFCTADFNMTQDAEAYREMTSYFKDVNMELARDLRGTYHGFGTTSRLIDFCFVNRRVRPIGYRLMDDKPGGIYVSDHYGICCDLALDEAVR